MLKGIDRILGYSELFKGKRLGLITSVSGVDNRLISTIEIIHRSFQLKALFAPEHGVRGEEAAGKQVEDYIDGITGVPVYSLYRKDRKRLSDEMLEQVDAVVYDIQDLGVRYYTFISTLIYSIMDCAEAGKQFIVLDRPNPLGGDILEGNVLDPRYKSFVGAYPLPVRYGLTAGELALMVNEEQKIGCDLSVVPCAGWRRSELFPETGQIWVMPSLGIPRFETALLYPGTCLFEGTNLSEGRGTSCPFELFGAPYLNAQEVVERLRQRKLAGVDFTPAYFTPSCSKYEGIRCSGVHIHITDYKTLESYRTGISILETIRDLYPEEFAFGSPAGEGGRAFISLLSGNNAFEDEDWTVKSILEQNERGLHEFRKMKSRYHIYS